MRILKQEKKRFFEFLDSVKQSYELVAPVNRDLVRFEKIENARDVYLEKNSYFPIKDYFFRKQEVLFKFNGNKIKVPALKEEARVFFGIRKCDLNAIRHQDIVFEKSNDPYYKSQRKNSYLIGYHCNAAPSPFCFCGSLELVDYADLMFYDRQDHFLVEVGTEKGEHLVRKFRNFFGESEAVISKDDKIIPGADRLEKKDISKLYEHPDWKKGVDLCLSCSACTSMCPTCYCFDIHDEVSAENTQKGERIRQWSSCQVQEFTKVAGNHIFRKKREERFKHRIYHQLDYFKQKNGIDLCVGCGRCIEACPTRIDFVEIINEMK